MKTPLFALLLSVFLTGTVWSQQQVTTSTPLNNIGSGYSEGSGVSWSLQGPGWFANFGGGGPLLPPFGPVDPNAGLSGGFAQNFGGGVSGRLNFNFYQGSNRSISSTTPSVTTMNGYPGSIQSGTVRPFVTGFTPIVGDYPSIPNPGEATAAAAQRQFDRVQASEKARYAKRLQKYLHRIKIAEEEGDTRMARANYRGAIRIAPEPLRSELTQRMQNLLRDAKD